MTENSLPEKGSCTILRENGDGVVYGDLEKPQNGFHFVLGGRHQVPVLIEDLVGSSTTFPDRSDDDDPVAKHVRLISLAAAIRYVDLDCCTRLSLLHQLWGRAGNSRCYEIETPKGMSATYFQASLSGSWPWLFLPGR